VSRQIKIERFAFSERFKAELQKLQPDVIEAVKKAVKLPLSDSIA
jgi:mRNA-degrading endonuclease RelE of RelBE toxin-antitoxin system